MRVFLATTGLLGLAIVAFVVWAVRDESLSRVITECDTPLDRVTSCTGFDDSWTECRWRFRAEGKPRQSHCEKFLEPSEAVPGYSEVPCEDHSLPSALRCFTAHRAKPEALRRTLQAFDADCRFGIVLESCNLPLSE